MKRLTKDQKAEILQHAKLAAIARCKQWEHEAAIEKILGYEVQIGADLLAAGLEGNADDMDPADIKIKFSDLDLNPV